jgi:pimeloyl-ACP methyl ester carboxylesterase
MIAKLGKFMEGVPYVKKVYYKLIGASDYYSAQPNMKKTMQNMLDSDKYIDPSIIKIPTQIIWGREDKFTPLKDAYKLKKAIAGSKLSIIDSAGHSPHATQPIEVANIIYDFIKN